MDQLITYLAAFLGGGGLVAGADLLTAGKGALKGAGSGIAKGATKGMGLLKGLKGVPLLGTAIGGAMAAGDIWNIGKGLVGGQGVKGGQLASLGLNLASSRVCSTISLTRDSNL